ncbi:hypothetical protein BD408DRAFT_417205 [Parasitella parasitica]|nr:hypothetical protein BD408DRAFT_417205 [Parasitella parasitica]
MVSDDLSKLYSRKRFKKGIENRLGGKKVTGNADILMFMNFLIFLEKLAEAAEKDAEGRGTKNIRPKDIKGNLEKTLRQFRG